MTVVYGALFISGLVLALYSLLDVATTPGDQVRTLPKAAWVVLIIVFPLLGSVGWLFAGRPQQRPGGLPYKGNRGAHPAGRQQLPPDDDPEFLRRADKAMAEDKDLLAKWEADLKRREDELRRREQGDDKG